MTNQRPITPPPELVGEWLCSEDYLSDVPTNSTMTITSSRLQNVATQAAQWGADQELEACLDWLDDTDCEDPQEVAQHLRAHRRPKPPSLKEQALKLIETYECPGGVKLTPEQCDTIRRAIEQLPDAL